MSDTKQDAAAIRKELKAAGYNARRVSVRTEYYSMGSSVYATIRDSGVDAAKVREIVERIGEHISRDERGEILSGGNTYVHVDYTTEVHAELSAKHEDAVQAAIDKCDAAKDVPDLRNYLHDVAGFSNVCVGLSSNGWAYSLWIDGTHGRDFDNAATGSLEIATSPKAAACDVPEPTPDPESTPEPTPAPVASDDREPCECRPAVGYEPCKGCGCRAGDCPASCCPERSDYSRPYGNAWHGPAPEPTPAAVVARLLP